MNTNELLFSFAVKAATLSLTERGVGGHILPRLHGSTAEQSEPEKAKCHMISHVESEKNQGKGVYRTETDP